MTFSTANNHWIKLVRKNGIYIRLPKLGVIKVRMHREGTRWIYHQAS
jgi:putative transposase